MENKNIQYFTEKIQLLMNAYNGNETGMAKYRYEKFNVINNYYLKNGFPKKCSEISFSLVPAIFQEAIYDGINWSTQNADLCHMEYYFELDCIFHNEGKRRIELSEKEFEEYVDFIDNSIKFAKNYR